MNYSASVFLINTSVRAIACEYVPADSGDRSAGKRYTFKSLDQSIRKDDLVVVPTDTRHGFTVVKVVETDVDVDFDNSAIQYKWIVSKVNLDAYKATLDMEEEAISKIRAAETRKKREDLRNNLLAHHVAELKDLQIADYGGGAAALSGPHKTAAEASAAKPAS